MRLILANMRAHGLSLWVLRMWTQAEVYHVSARGLAEARSDCTQWTSVLSTADMCVAEELFLAQGRSQHVTCMEEEQRARACCLQRSSALPDVQQAFRNELSNQLLPHGGSIEEKHYSVLRPLSPVRFILTSSCSLVAGVLSKKDCPPSRDHELPREPGVGEAQRPPHPCSLSPHEGAQSQWKSLFGNDIRKQDCFNTGRSRAQYDLNYCKD